MIAPTCQLLYAIVGACHPIFPLFLAALAASGLSGFIDGSVYSWIGEMDHANVIIGLLHSAFSVGCIAGPFLAGSLTNIWSRPWYHWYILMVCALLFTMCRLTEFNLSAFSLSLD
jgi:MFS family permease